MQAGDRSTEEDADFARFLERRIIERTGGRISGVLIEISDGRVIVRGHTETQHAKQLVLEAVAELKNASVELDIQVGTTGARGEPEHDGRAKGED